MNVWSARTGAGLDDAFAAFSSSIAEDQAFLEHDIVGSIAHVQGLADAGLLSSSEADRLSQALRALLHEATQGTFVLDAALEDVHMNIEHALTQRLGDLGRRLHTGRSRNDQVATCIVLYARQALHDLATGCLAVADRLIELGRIHQATPWVARTHGQPAQPATLGFLLMAHAFRFQDAARQAIAAFHDVGESPLGSGAVAGSTLPLRPDLTAALLGLRPPRNALLATGGRDHVLTTLRATTTAGAAAASLAEDLFGLATQGAYRLPDGLATGSSLMPQKRNPDALELVRGHARALVGHEHAVQAVCIPLGLGYVRDLQVVKPHLVHATQQAAALLDVLRACLDGTVLVEALAHDEPGIGATDAAEALVQAGMPFRAAYEAVAKAHQTDDPAAALAATLPQDVAEAAIQALVPDAARRRTLGAPAALDHALAMASKDAAELHARLEAAADAIAVAGRLLDQEVLA